MLQGILELSVRVRVAVALIKILCTVFGMIGLLGALQTFPAIAVMTSAVTQSLGKLLEFSIMVITILPLLALILYNSNIADENLSLPSYLGSYMVLSTLSGTLTLQFPPSSNFTLLKNVHSCNESASGVLCAL